MLTVADGCSGENQRKPYSLAENADLGKEELIQMKHAKVELEQWLGPLGLVEHLHYSQRWGSTKHSAGRHVIHTASVFLIHVKLSTARA